VTEAWQYQAHPPSQIPSFEPTCVESDTARSKAPRGISQKKCCHPSSLAWERDLSMTRRSSLPDHGVHKKQSNGPPGMCQRGFLGPSGRVHIRPENYCRTSKKKFLSHTNTRVATAMGCKNPKSILFSARMSEGPATSISTLSPLKFAPKTHLSTQPSEIP